MAAPVIQFKRGPSANLPGLAAGEPGFTTDRYELWVGLDGTGPNNKFFGSSRYWSPESNTQGGGLRFYEGYDNGNQEVRLVAPNSIPTTQKYTLPLNPQNDFILVTNSDGEWRWTNTLVDVTLTGQVEISGNIISDGDISIGGTSAVFNTEIFDTEARIFNVGLSTDPAPTDTTWDLGVLFNYYKSGTRYRSGIFWDDSTGRIGISSNVSVINNEFGAGDGDPVIDTSSVVYAPLVLSELWVSDCTGESVAITCANSERTLENISIDGGFY